MNCICLVAILENYFIYPRLLARHNTVAEMRANWRRMEKLALLCPLTYWHEILVHKISKYDKVQDRVDTNK